MHKFYKNNKKKDVQKFDLVMFRDHGQRKFRMSMKMIAIFFNDSLFDLQVMKVVYKYCKKYNYETLKGKIGIPLN